MSRLLVVSIIIVDYFKAERVIANVQSAITQIGDFQFEIIVIDNSCNDNNKRILQELDKQENVSIIFNTNNVGYIKACNQGVGLARGDFIFLVNPDIAWKSNNIITQVVNKFNADTSIGIIGTRQVNDDGTTPDTVRRFPNITAQISRRTFLRKLPWFRSRVADYEVNDFDYSVSADVDWVQSSFMAIRKVVWDSVGGLDTSYFLFMSDPDICYKAWSSGYRVYYMSQITVGADGKRCSAGGFRAVFTNKAVRHHIHDALIYSLKHILKKKITAFQYRN